MPRKLLFIVGLAAGYVIGARAGREQYDKLVAQVDTLWKSPRVVKARTDVEAYARQQAPVIAERARAVAEAAPGVVADTARKGADVAKDVADRTTVIAKDVAGRTTIIAKDATNTVTGVAQDLAEKAADAAGTVTARVKKSQPISVKPTDTAR